ncbi:MAG: GNAT family N-acetyltransferase [Candidatus Limnocylindrales bacterium]
MTQPIAPCAEGTPLSADDTGTPAVPDRAQAAPRGSAEAPGAGLVRAPETAPASVGSRRRLVAQRVAFDAIPRAAWDRLLARTACATPFSRWAFHRAWWDGYGGSAHEDYLVCRARATDPAAPTDPAGAPEGTAPDSGLDPDAIVAIVPLMHRHEVEPDDAILRTAIRHAPRTALTPLPDRANAIFLAASYHADYATVLCDPTDLPAVADALADALADGPDLLHGAGDWDVVDLRRLRADDPALAALESAFRAAAERHGWQVSRELEEVCPVLRVETGDWDAFLESLSTKNRHEIRRKLRRAEASGPVVFDEVTDPATAVDDLIAIHQARWGDQGLFPQTEGGARSRRFIRRLAAIEGPDGTLRIGRLQVGGRCIFMCVGFHAGDAVYYYNAGSDPGARALSPGVIGVAAYLRHGLERGYRVFDFLRGNEPYKYTWGAQDQPIYRLIVTRAAPA